MVILTRGILLLLNILHFSVFVSFPRETAHSGIYDLWHSAGVSQWSKAACDFSSSFVLLINTCE